MSDNRSISHIDLVDRIALELQRLQSANRVDDDQPLLRIDNRREAADAPFQFDIVESILHRTHCTAIPKRSRSALYALWEIQTEDLKYACPRCRPILEDAQPDSTNSMDLLYGLLSIVDQFGSILSERGREYRASEKGRQVEATVARMIGELEQQQVQTTNVLSASIDGLIRVLHDLGGNGTMPTRTSGNGHARVEASQKPNGRAAGSNETAKKSKPRL